MSEENSSSAILESRETRLHQKWAKSDRRLLIFTIACFALGIGLFLIVQACSVQHHSQYATGAEYTTTGYVEQAKKEVKRTSGSRKKHTHYTVKLRMVEPLPNGEHEFTSNEFSEYSVVSKFADKPDVLVRFTISDQGYITKAEQIEEDQGTEEDNLISNLENMTDNEQSSAMYELWKKRNQQ